MFIRSCNDFHSAQKSPQGFSSLTTSNSRLDNFFRLKIPLQTACLTFFLLPFNPIIMPAHRRQRESERLGHNGMCMLNIFAHNIYLEVLIYESYPAMLLVCKHSHKMRALISSLLWKCGTAMFL